MNILAWFNPTRWLILAALAGALVLGYFAWASHQQDIGENRATARYEAALSQQKAEASAKLQAETAKVKQTESQLNAARAALEDKDAQAAKTIAQLRADLRRKSRAAGGPGLRDPFAGSRLGGSGPLGIAAPGSIGSAASPAEASGLLSEPLERLLLEDYADADELNRAYAACRADAFSVRELMPK